MLDLLKKTFWITGEDEEPEKEKKVFAELVFAVAGDKPAPLDSVDLDQAPALVAGAGAGGVSDSSPAQDPVPVPAPVPPLAPAQDPDPVSTIEPIRILVDSIFNNEDDKKYFFSIFMPLAESEDITKKSTALTPSSDPILSSKQETELREALQKCASAYDIPLDPQSVSTKITSTSSSTSKAQPPVYFGVGIKTELAEADDEKFLKITEIFSNSNLRKEKQGNVDYTNQFITHLNCKLGNDTVAHEYSITEIFKSFENTPNQKEKFDEKIDQIFRDLKESYIKFKISASKSQTDPATQPTEVNVNKIIFEKTQDGAYKQKTTTPSTIIHSTAAIGKGAGAGAGAGEKKKGMVA